MKIATRLIPYYDYDTECKFCGDSATDEINMNNTVTWFVCMKHKQNFDMLLAFQDLIHGK